MSCLACACFGNCTATVQLHFEPGSDSPPYQNDALTSRSVEILDVLTWFEVGAVSTTATDVRNWQTSTGIRGMITNLVLARLPAGQGTARLWADGYLIYDDLPLLRY